MRLIAVFLLATTWMLTSESAKADVSCHAVADEVARKGADATVRDLTSRTNGDWDHFIDQVSAGSQDCITAAAAVEPGADAAAHEGVIYGLSQALQENPEAVLGVLGGRIPLNRVCMDRTIEGTDEQHKVFIQRATAALSRIREPSVLAKRDTCLASLKAE